MKFDNDKVHQYFKNIKKKVVDFENLVVSELSEKFSEELNVKLDSNQQDYTSRIAKSDDGYVVVVDEKSTEVGELPQYTVFLYQARSAIVEGSPYWPVLKKYQPYAKEFVPLSPEGALVLVSRQVTEEEYIAVTEKNDEDSELVRAYLGQFDEIATRILSSGEVPSQTQVTEDLVWSVLRRELGLREERIPCWLPVVRRYRSGTWLNSLLTEDQFNNILFKSSLRLKQVEQDSVSDSDYERFQNVILKI